ncbi:gluzincin family metallopeptidase [Spirosoma rhododendri]|uniref:hypothetical protein n=1 Tax=Spirosoma rhododendri TaxID=2728024 RepID=UPI0020C3D8DF|nr:hypothetical protein [Spirosoma rhododendri]
MKLTSAAILLFGLTAAQAQTLYMPRNVKQAYQKGTRAMDGKPGPRYWQNRAHYTINITATPPSRTINGTEQITYVNNSPDTLKTLAFKLFMNIHRPEAGRQGAVSEDYLTSGVTIDKYTENQAEKKWSASKDVNQRMVLSKPLLPHDSVKLGFDWHYDLSKESGREGVLDSTTFFLAYFYPVWRCTTITTAGTGCPLPTRRSFTAISTTTT